MSAIKSAHDLLDATQETPVLDGNDVTRSRYCYLFAKLADQDDAGCFKGCDEVTSIARLKEFEAIFREVPQPTLSIGLPPSYTYFGQFMNHDISAPFGGLLVDAAGARPVGIIGTADPAGLNKNWRADTANILEHFLNEHGEPLMLGSLYGEGPNSDDDEVSSLYALDKKRFRLANTRRVDPQFFIAEKFDPEAVFHTEIANGIPAPDIPRKGGVPLIADHRNDGNLILSQLHLAFMLAHNKAVVALENRIPPSTDCFREARELITLHYHWLILNDFLPSLLSKSVLSQPLAKWVPRKPDETEGLKGNEVPMEFTTAAFRFGHSIVGQAYDFNANFGVGGIIKPEATFDDLLAFTSEHNMGSVFASSSEPNTDNPDEEAVQLPDHWVIDWDRMSRTSQPGPANADHPRGAEQIDMSFARDMLELAGAATVPEHGSIMFRNLLRGFHRRMPFGQLIATAYGITPLSKAEVQEAMSGRKPTDYTPDDVGALADRLGFLEHTPAWLYFLCEAKFIEKGARVGPTASRIIVDTIISLMRNNPRSLLGREGGTWHPRQSPLRDKNDNALESIRAFLMFATDPP